MILLFLLALVLHLFLPELKVEVHYAIWPLIGGIASLGLGIGKAVSDRGAEEEQGQLAGETKRWSPFTGMKAQPVQKEPSPWSTILGMGLKGAELGVGIENYLDEKDVKDLTKQISNKLIEKGVNPWSAAREKAFGGYDKFDINPEYMGNQMPKLQMPGLRY